MKELMAAIELARPNFGPITKNKKNPFFHSWYADLDEILAAVEMALIEQGVSITHKGFTTGKGDFLVTSLFHRPTGQSEASYFPMSSVSDVRLDKEGNQMWVTPQNIGAAMTYGRRYNLVALLNLQTESDDDGNAASNKQAPPEVKTFVATEDERNRMMQLLSVLKDKEKPIVPQSQLRKELMKHKVEYDDSRKEFTGLSEDVYRLVEAIMQRVKKEIMEKK